MNQGPAEGHQDSVAVPGTRPSARDLFAAALGHHQAGRLQAAERLYQQVLATNPRHADAFHLLGVVALQTGRTELAADMIREAIAIDPNIASYHSNMGAALSELRRLDEAVVCYRSALALTPRYPEAHNNLGTTLRELGRLDEAIAHYREALRFKPDYAEAYFNLGISLARQGRSTEAADCYGKALELRPEFPEAHDALGNIRREQVRLDEAVTCYRKALGLRPNYPEALSNLGSALKEQGLLDEAVACCLKAIELKADFPEAYNNLGSARAEQGRLDEAVGCYRRALDLKASFPEAFNNLGTALMEQRRLDEAVACFRRAIDLQPGYADAHFSLGMALLAQGDMATGWAEYEWRWQTPQMIKGRGQFAQPQWRGEAATGRTLLIHTEQGFGDTLQFCRYATLAKQRGLRVVMEAEKPLVRLLRGLSGVDLVVTRGEPLPAFDLHCPLLSMPLALATRLATIPRGDPYLHADAEPVAAWRRRLEDFLPGAAVPPDARPPARAEALGTVTSSGKLRVGLAWAGNPRLHSPALAAVDRRRSIAPERLAPLAALPGLHFVSLQKGGPAAPADLELIDFMDQMEDFADTAALIANLDLVISVDTAVAHLVAALGKPVWLLDRFDSCWRWLNGRRDSPWYPSIRLYRQPRPGDWDTVLEEVVRDLTCFAGGVCPDGKSPRVAPGASQSAETGWR
jgi:tetratricopeptide (TPR) repeat protein